MDTSQPPDSAAHLPSPLPARRHDTRRHRWLTTLADAVVALGIGLLTGLIAHRLAGEEPLTTEEEYVGHLFAEMMIVVLAAVIAFWLLEDIRAARRRRREAPEATEGPPD